MQSIRQYHHIGPSLQQQIYWEMRKDSLDGQQHAKQSLARDCVTEKPLTQELTQVEAKSAAKTSTPGSTEKTESCNVLLRLGHVQVKDYSNGADAVTSREIFVVTFADNDPLKPGNWSRAKKWMITAMVGAIGLLASGAAAFDSEVVPQAMEEYHTSNDVALLATVLYMIWFGIGTLFSGPLSETFGRNPVYITSLILFMLFTIGSAAAPNVKTWLICRSFMGLFGSPPAVTFGGSMSDMWSPLERVYVFPILAALTFLGPFLAPVIADYIATSPHVSWHFVDWLTLILAGAVCFLIACFVEETYVQTILSWKARHIRRITGDDRYVSLIEIKRNTLAATLIHNVRRPWVFLLQETIVGLFALYLVVIYIILFGSLVAFSYIFGRQGAGQQPNLAIYFLSQREVGLCYIPMNIGFSLALLLCYPIYRRFVNIMVRENRERVQPEEHLLWAMVGAPLLPASILWLGLTAKPEISILSPLFATGLFGFATICIFITCYQYIIDSYEEYAASALVGMTVTRYVAAAALLPACTRMYVAIGAPWSLVIWACVSALLAPVPYWFYWRGARIRLRSHRATKYGTEDAAARKESYE